METNGNGKRINDITLYQWATGHVPGNELAYVTAGLVDQAREICDNRCGARAQLADQLGDLLWYTAQLATELGLDLGKIAADNITKLVSTKTQTRVDN